MSEQSWNTWFDTQLDRLTTNDRVPNAVSKQTKNNPPAELVDDLFMATRLANLNMSDDTKLQAMLRTRLAWMTMAKTPNTRRFAHSEQPYRALLHFRITWMVGVVTVFLAIFLTAFNQPVLAMAQHILGYGYLPEVGFFHLSKTRLLKGPVEFQQNQQLFIIQQGITQQSGPAGPGTTWLWFDGDSNSLNLGETWLELAGGEQLPVQSIKRLGNNQTQLEFGILPEESIHSNLRLAGGIIIPLDWIPATEAGLAPTRVSSSIELTQITNRMTTTTPCLNITDQLMLCAQAAHVDRQGTHLLLELQSIQNEMAIHRYIKMINQAELRDDNHQTYSLTASIPGDMDETNSLTLQFAPIPDEIENVTLRMSGIHIQQDGNEIEVAGPFNLALRLPVRMEKVIPTPSFIQSSEWQSVPTPVITERPR